MKIFLFLFAIAMTMFACNSEPSAQLTAAQVQQNTKGKVLFIVSNAQYYGKSDIGTANHFAEIVLPYDVLIKAGYLVDFVSPEGGAIPLGYLDTSNEIIKKHLYDGTFMDQLEHTQKPSEVNAADYQAVYYGGGGSAMFGVPENEAIQKIAMDVYEEHDGIISAVCHGTAGIAHLKTKDGKYLVEGKKVNGFPDKFENMKGRYYQEFPFSIEQIIKERGGDFQYSEEGWDGFFLVDGKLITGQDPTGAASVAEKIVEALKGGELKS